MSAVCTPRRSSIMKKPPNSRRADGPIIENFLDMMSAERGASRNTLSAYARDLTDFAGSLAGQGGSIRDADHGAVKKYLASLSGSGLAPSSQARKLSALRQFYAFLYAEGIRGDDPTNAIETPKRGRVLPKVLSEDDVGKLIDTARAETKKEKRGEEAIRLLCMVEILYASGLRVSE